MMYLKDFDNWMFAIFFTSDIDMSRVCCNLNHTREMGVYSEKASITQKYKNLFDLVV